MDLSEKQARVLSKIANQEEIMDEEKTTRSKLQRHTMVMINTGIGWLWDRDDDDYIHASKVDYDWVMTGKGEKKLREYRAELLEELDQISGDDVLHGQQLSDLSGRVYKPEHTHEKVN